MTLAERFRKVTELLKKENIPFALAGGLSASLYRDEERLTKDIDFLIAASSDNESKAISIIEKLGLKASIITDAQLAGGPLFKIKNKSGIPMMIVGRADDHANSIGIDFILPTMPWAIAAFERAQHMKVNFGFGEIPTLTVEDLIIAKLFAFKNDGTRLKDCDDIQSIFRAKRDLDIPYFAGKMREYRLTLPSQVATFAGEELNRVSKSVNREIKRDIAKRRTKLGNKNQL